MAKCLESIMSLMCGIAVISASSLALYLVIKLNYYIPYRQHYLLMASSNTQSTDQFYDAHNHSLHFTGTYVNDTTAVRNHSNLIFIHIPKTGGTTIEELFYHEFNVRLGHRATNWKVDWRIKTKPWGCTGHHTPINWIYQHMIEKGIKNLSEISPYLYSKQQYIRSDSFAVVRNPYSRFVSQYQYCTGWSFNCVHALTGFFAKYCMRYLNDSDVFCRNLKEIRKNSQKNQSIWKQLDFCSISTFNKYASVVLKWLINTKTKRKTKMDCHYVKQSEYIYYFRNKSDQMVKYVLKTEDLSNDLRNLGKVYGLEINQQKINRANEAFKKNCVKLNAKDLNMENRKLLRRFYYDDFINFNYSFME